jgi:hypothetical protein
LGAYFHLEQLFDCKGVHKKVRKSGQIKYEPCVFLNGVRIYFQEKKLEMQVALICNVAKFFVGIIGRHGFNLHPSHYTSLSLISNNCSHEQIKCLVLERAKGLQVWLIVYPSNMPNDDATSVGFDEFVSELLREQPL